jgi:hypothetical protein
VCAHAEQYPRPGRFLHEGVRPAARPSDRPERNRGPRGGQRVRSSSGRRGNGMDGGRDDAEAPVSDARSG